MGTLADTARQPDQGALTRRGFLRTSAASLAATTTLAISQRAYAQGEGTIRIGMIGAGGRCSGAAAEAMSTGEDVKLVAMCDIFSDRLQSSRGALKDMLPNQVAVDDDHCFTEFDGYRHVIEASDVVLIACASKFHPMYAEAAVQAGKHVFVEKPCGIDPRGVRRMQAACDLARQKGVSIVSGLQSRYHAGWQETVRRIHDGEIGEITAVQSMFLRGPYRVFARPEGMPETQYQFLNWYHFRWLSGDDVPQSLVHNMDRVEWVMREEPPQWCFGLGGRSASFGEQYGDMYDHHTVVYSYASGAQVYALCRTQDGCYGNSTDIIMGTKATCYLGDCRFEGEVNWQYEGPGNNPYEAEQNALIESVRKGVPINAGEFMAKSTMVGVMGQLACYSGQPVTWDEAMASEIGYGPEPEEASFDTPPPTRPDATGNYPLPMPGVTDVATL